MALPFQVFDYRRQFNGYVWCVRCQRLIKSEVASGEGAFDLHVEDHLQAWQMLSNLHRDKDESERTVA